MQSAHFSTQNFSLSIAGFIYSPKILHMFSLIIPLEITKNAYVYTEQRPDKNKQVTHFCFR